MAQTPLFKFSDYTPRDLEIIDTTLREGSQSSLLHDHYKYFFNQNDKIEIVRALIIYGVKFIELFAPIVSPREKEDIEAIKAVRDELIMQKGYTFLLAHVRCHPDDIESAIDAGFDGLNFYIGASDHARTSSHGKSLPQIIEQAGKLIQQVRENYPHLVLRFSGEDAFRTHEADLYQVYDHIAPFVDRFGTPDTVGVAMPNTVTQRIKDLRKRYPHVDLEGHFHHDRGFSLVNSLQAIEQGMRYINTTVLGIGERSGITSMTSLLFNLCLDRQFDKLEGYHLRGSYPMNVLLASKLNKLVPSRESVSLTNRTHTAGVHQKAMLNSSITYEAHPFDQFGVSESEILLGPLSGWNTIYYFLKEIKYYQLDQEMARQISKVFKDRIYDLKADETPSEVLLEIATGQFNLKQVNIPEAYRDTVVQRFDSSSQS